MHFFNKKGAFCNGSDHLAIKMVKPEKLKVFSKNMLKISIFLTQSQI